VISEREWERFGATLREIDDICSRRGLVQVFHCHVDSIVETADEIDRVLAETDVSFVLDTGHMSIGGRDPLQFARDHVTRVGLVHLKDVDSRVALRLNSGELSLMEAVQAGLFPSLGDGDVPIGEIVMILESAGYRGMYVVEQDAAITDGEPAEGEGPIRDVERSVAFIRSIEI